MKTISILILAVLIAPFCSCAQKIAVELQKMNVLYVGVDNPIRIAIENYSCDKIIVKAKYGKLIKRKNSCEYNYTIDSCNIYKEIISVGIKINNKIKWLKKERHEYRIKRNLMPLIRICDIEKGMIKKEQIKIGFIIARDEHSEIYSAKVVKYSYEIRRNNSILVKETDINGCYYSEKLKSESAKAQSGDVYFFFDVKVETTSDKCDRPLQSTIYIIE